MSETSHNDTLDNSARNQSTAPEGNFSNEAVRASWETAAELKAAYKAWLERRDIDLVDTPDLTMTSREFEMFRRAPSNYLDEIRRIFDIPQGDQTDCQYALIYVESDNTNLPPHPLLVIVDQVDFGTVIDPERILSDFEQPGSDPNDPSPESPVGALKTIDIKDTLIASRQRLEESIKVLMKDQVIDPFNTSYGDVRVRAGGLMAGQQDAYVWTARSFTRSIELTLAFPGKYDSVCIIRGQEEEAPNGKAGMARIKDPKEVLKIEGENLENLQRVYAELYQQPNFALTDAQRRERDEIYNDYLTHLISKEARNSSARKDDEYRRQRPQLRRREMPHS